MIKSILLLLVSVFSFSSLALAQEGAAKDLKMIGIRISCGASQMEPVLYIIKHKNEELVLKPRNGKKNPVFEEINPSQVKALSVLKGKKAIKRYGESGKNGVVVITVTKRLWKRLFQSQKKLENN